MLQSFCLKKKSSGSLIIGMVVFFSLMIAAGFVDEAVAESNDNPDENIVGVNGSSPVRSVLDLLTPIHSVSAEEVHDNSQIEEGRVSQLLLPAFNFSSSSTSVNAEAEISRPIELESIYVVGSRAPERSVLDLPVPVDIVTAEDMRDTGQTEVGRMLQRLIPSFNFSSSSISDGTDALRPATLRGLSPDQVLVLINGKRRHNSALIHVNTSVGRGTAGVDMNAIPASAIKRIEILRDGAAAQYGSDAIAGVINIVLKDGVQEGFASGSYGQYLEGDGENILFNAGQGFRLNGGKGFIHASLEYRNRKSTNRAGLTGECQYTCTPAGTNSNGAIQQTTDQREINFNRKNFRIGDAESEQFSGVLNAELELGGGELYGFLTRSGRENTSAGFFRRANQTESNPVLGDGEAFFPNGFLPLINTDVEDFSINAGFRRKLDWGIDADFSITHGLNDFAFNISNSVNASQARKAVTDSILTSDEIRASLPTSADAGELGIGLTTANIDLVKRLGDLTLTGGAEYRHDTYTIKAGDEVSFADFDINDNTAVAGIQVFPGFQPSNEVDESRNIASLYADVGYDVNSDWQVNSALRFDHYSDFGGTLNFKLATRYAFTDWLILRASGGSGFRAPSMQQQFFNNVSTQFNDINGVVTAEQVGTFRNDSALARAIGIPELKEETSYNLGVGVVFQPFKNFTLTADYYRITIDDRIVLSGRLESGANAALDAALTANGVQSAQFFLNAVDTETNGIDIVATWKIRPPKGQLELSLGASYTDTEITGIFSPDSLQGVALDTVFSAQDSSIIESWQPKSRLNLSADYALGDFSMTLALNRFGEYTVLDGDKSQTYGAKVLTDLLLRYNFPRNITLSLGANNLFDVVPEKNRIGQSRNGTIIDGDGNTIVSSSGVFEFSRRSAPFGFNGGYYFARLTHRF